MPASGTQLRPKPLPQVLKPWLHARPQPKSGPAVPASQLLVPPADGQAMQLLPQVASAPLETHTPPQLWKPALQVAPQLVPSQVATPFTGFGHELHDVDPQVKGLEFEAHWPLQT